MTLTKIVPKSVIRAADLIKAFKKRSKARRDIGDLANKLGVSVTTAKRAVRQRGPWTAVRVAERRVSVRRAVAKIGTIKSAVKLVTPLRTVQRDAQRVFSAQRRRKKKRLVARMVRPDEIAEIAALSQRSASGFNRSRNICT